MPPGTRKKLVAAAARRFYRDGFRNVGLDQILSDVGISKTAFYKHFQCKEDLMLAALDDRDQWIQDTFRELARKLGGRSAAAQLLALFDVVDTILATDGFQGCIFVNAAIEFPLPHEPAHIAAARSKQAMENLVAEIAAEAGARDPRALAQELCLLMEGVYVTRHVSGNPDAVQIARRIAARVLKGHLP